MMFIFECPTGEVKRLMETGGELVLDVKESRLICTKQEGNILWQYSFNRGGDNPLPLGTERYYKVQKPKGRLSEFYVQMDDETHEIFQTVASPNGWYSANDTITMTPAYCYQEAEFDTERLSVVAKGKQEFSIIPASVLKLTKLFQSKHAVFPIQRFMKDGLIQEDFSSNIYRVIKFKFNKVN